MNKINYRGVVYIIIMMMAFSSCTTYYSAMTNAKNDPERQKLVNLEVVTKLGTPEIPKQVIENDLVRNVIDDSQKDILGRIEIAGTLKSYKDFISPFLSIVSVGYLPMIGIPMYGGKVSLNNFSFTIRDFNNSVVKEYSYSEKKSYAKGLYYGMDNKEAQVVVSRSIMKKFRIDLRKDIVNINQKLDDVYYASNPRPITVEPVVSQNQTSQDSEIDKQAELLALTLQKLQANTNNIPNNTQSQELSSEERTLSDVDQNIPVANVKKTDTYVLIVANEDYLFVDKVPFAKNDGETFREYCIKTLGIPEKQVRLCINASAGILAGGIDWLTYALNNFDNSKAIVYYCGHGIPDEKTGDAYIIPTDGKGTNTSTCYSLNTLYKTLAATKAIQITYFMDACFTGANKEGSMLVAARGIAREAKKETLEGNSIVFSAASGDETAMSYPEKQHGLFTYFLLKKLQETKGDISYEDLAKYINENVKKEAFLTNEKPQNPVIATSPSAEQTWKTMQLK